MLNGQQKQMIENLQGKIHNYLNSYKSSLTLPEYKFVRDATIGILKSSSFTVNQIGIHLGEEITLKKTCERMYRQVRSAKLTEKLRLNIQQKQCRLINKETLIIVEDSGIKRVQVWLDPHPKKHPETVEVWLIIARYKPNKQGKAGYFYFFCDFPHQDLTELEIMSKALNSYGQRWKIEQLHRQIKQDYKWEAIQLMSFTGLKNMNLLLLLAMCFLYSLKRITIQLMKAFPHIMKYSNHKWKQIYDFVYYRIANLLDLCLGYLSKYNITTFKWLKKEKDQTYIMRF